MPRNSSGDRNVARSLATATSASIAIIMPPPWARPLIAHTTGLGDRRTASNGVLSMPSSRGRSAQPSTLSPPRSPPGMNTSPEPVSSSPASVVAVDEIDGVAHAEVHGRRHRVAPLRPVDGDDGQRVPAARSAGRACPASRLRGDVVARRRPNLCRRSFGRTYLQFIAWSVSRSVAAEYRAGMPKARTTKASPAAAAGAAADGDGDAKASRRAQRRSLHQDLSRAQLLDAPQPR